MSAGYIVSQDSEPGSYYNKVLPEALTLCSEEVMYGGGYRK